MFNSIALALGISLANGVLIYFSLLWATRQSDKVFYSTFFGGMVWKLFVLGVTVFAIYGNPHFNLWVTLISMVLFTFLFSLISIFWIKRHYGFQRNS